MVKKGIISGSLRSTMVNFIVIQSEKSAVKTRLPGGKALRFSYELPKILQFDEPYVARLAGFSGIASSLIVCCDFVAQQSLNGEYKPVLGIKSQVSSNTWVPLASNYISNRGFIELIASAPGTSIRKEDINRATIAIELAPAASVYYGTHGRV